MRYLMKENMTHPIVPYCLKIYASHYPRNGAARYLTNPCFLLSHNKQHILCFNRMLKALCLLVHLLLNVLCF